MASGLLSDNGLKDQQAQKDSDGPDLQKEKKKKKREEKEQDQRLRQSRLSTLLSLLALSFLSSAATFLFHIFLPKEIGEESSLVKSSHLKL